MSSPPRTPQTGQSAEGPRTEEKRVEGIKQYYQQLCANYRLVSQQLQHPDLPASRRPILTAQLEKLQQALQDFTERVIRPIINANRTGNGKIPTPTEELRSGRSTTGTEEQRPTTIATLGTSLMGAVASSIRPTKPMVRIMTGGRVESIVPTPSSVTTSGSVLVGGGGGVTVENGRTITNASITSSNNNNNGIGMVSTSNTAQFLEQTKLHDGVLLEKSLSITSRNQSATLQTNRSLLSSSLPPDLSTQIQVSQQAEDLLLEMADRFLASACQGVCESARHRKRPGIATRDFELVLGREIGMSVTTAGLAFAVPPAAPTKAPSKKTSAVSNPHHNRMLQLRKNFNSAI